MPRRDQNEIIRFAALMAEKAGVDHVPDNKLLGAVGGITKSAGGLMREAFVKGVLDKVLQDKVRKLMQWVIHTQFSPDFSTKLDAAALGSIGGAGDFNLRAIKPDGDRIPFRMFNVDTGSLEEWISGDVSYCILSHSWKGSEIVFPFFQAIKADVREKGLFDDLIAHATDEDTKRFARVQSAKHFHLHAEFSDVQLIRIQCLKDLDDQTRRVTLLLSGSQAVSGLLTEDEAGLDREAIFRLRCTAFARSIDSKRDAILPYLQSLVDSKTTGSEEWSATRRDHAALAAAVEQLLPMIERIRSLQKIEQSMVRTKQILDSGCFSSASKAGRYLWNDTICINKQDANELNHSLAMMGEWYSGAEFCLVQIDTPVNEWIQTFKHLDKPHAQTDAPKMTPGGYGHGLYNAFDELYNAEPRPKWATRGWTLQELVLPKLAIYTNSVWEPLPRAVEALGDYYYLVSFLAEHVYVDGQLDSLRDVSMLQQVMTGGQVEYIKYELKDFKHDKLSSDETAWTDKVRRLIGLLEFFGVKFNKNMNEDTAEILIQQAINSGADSECDLEAKASIIKSFGLNTTHASQGTRTFIKLVIKALVSEAEAVVEYDRKKMSQFGAVPPDECCRGFRRSHNSAQEMLSLAAYRECTVATDRVYSLMGVLGVQFTVFHAEGMTKALSRMLDEVVTTTNDISVFNWTGRDFGSPQRGRSLYPSALEAYDPIKAEGVSVAQRRMKDKQDKVAAFNERKYNLQLTSKNLTILLNDLAKFVKGQDRRHWDPEPVRRLLGVVKTQTLEKLKPQVNIIGKLISFFETEVPKMDGAVDSPKTMSPPETPITPASPPMSPSATPAAESGKKTRLGIKAPKVPSISSMSPNLSSISPSLPSMPSFGKGNTESKIPSAPSERPVFVSRKSEKLSSVQSWLSETDSLEKSRMNYQVQQILDGIAARSLATKTPQAAVAKDKRQLPAEDAVSPNPIIITTAGIQGLFDVQRIIIDIKDRDVLRAKAQSVASAKQKINGNCRISTAIASLEVDFRCTAEQLIKQINMCDVVDLTVFGDQGRATPQDLTSKNQQLQVERALDFVEETDLNMIAGEWVLARFSGAPSAKWFLSTFELGASNAFYGQRIPTNDIDFALVEPETLLVKPWEEYMEKKKEAMYQVVENQLQGKDVQKAIDRLDGKLRQNDEDDDQESTLNNLIGRTASIAQQGAGLFYEGEAQRLDAALNDAALTSTPKKLREAVMSLNDNEELLPAMFVSDVMIHMF